MAETAAPARKRAPRKTTTSTVAAVATPVVTTDDKNRERYVIDMLPDPDGPTKSYSRWVYPEGSGCTGRIYAPLGTEEVKIALIGPKN